MVEKNQTFKWLPKSNLYFNLYHFLTLCVIAFKLIALLDYTQEIISFQDNLFSLTVVAFLINNASKTDILILICMGSEHLKQVIKWCLMVMADPGSWPWQTKNIIQKYLFNLLCPRKKKYFFLMNNNFYAKLYFSN